MDNSFGVLRLFLLKLRPLIGQLFFPRMKSEGMWSIVGTSADWRKPKYSGNDLSQGL